MKRRTILIAALAAPLLPAGLAPLRRALAQDDSGDAAPAFDPKVVGEGERVLGSADAPVTIIEYASLTCGHCASFHTGTLPQVRSEWIEPGKARLVFRHFPLDRLALIGAVAADCLQSDKAFFAYIGTLFAEQGKWARADDPVGALAQRAALAGLNRAQFDACIEDQAATDALLSRVIASRDAFGIEATPTLIVNERKIEGAMPYDEFAEVLEQAHGGA